LDWAPTDTFATFFTLVGSLTIDENTQLRAAAAREEIPDNHRFLDLWSLEPIKKSPVLEAGTYPPASASLAPKKMDTKSTNLLRRAKDAIASLSADLSATEMLRRIFPESQIAGSDIGSNNWVLGGSKTADGNTLLSNDPHLGLSQPPVWYIAHMDAKTNGSGTMHTAGVTLAGIPGAVIGQNEDIAWGATNTGLDFSDVYIEELVKNEQGDPIGVMFNGEVVEFIRVDFTMSFNDGSSATRELLFVPHHGSVRTLDADNDIAITLRWTGNDMDTDANYLLGIATATSVEEARAALENVTSLGQNWVVIDNQETSGGSLTTGFPSEPGRSTSTWMIRASRSLGYRSPELASMSGRSTSTMRSSRRLSIGRTAGWPQPTATTRERASMAIPPTTDLPHSKPTTSPMAIARRGSSS
jgi:penicillin amidase